MSEKYPSSPRKSGKKAAKKVPLYRRPMKGSGTTIKEEPEASDIKKPMLIRFDEAQRTGLSDIKEQLGTAEAELVRWAVDALIRKWKREKRLVLPLVFTEEEMEAEIKRRVAEGG